MSAGVLRGHAWRCDPRVPGNDAPGLPLVCVSCGIATRRAVGGGRVFLFAGKAWLEYRGPDDARPAPCDWTPGAVDALRRRGFTGPATAHLDHVAGGERN